MTIPKKITELIQSSGNNFHSKVARWFSDQGWHVVVSPYYMDQTQSKAREIDLVAEKLWPVTERFGRPKGHLAVRLFIECKFVATDAVFWFADKDHESAIEMVCSTGVFRRGNTFIKKHHYVSQSSRVAKLFATDNAKATENEPFYKALNQALNAMTSMRARPVTIPEIPHGLDPSTVFEYPVVLCSSFDRVFKVDFDAESDPTPVNENFQLEVRYAYIDRQQKQKNEYFLLDFVAFDKLAEFEHAIDEGMGAAVLLSSD